MQLKLKFRVYNSIINLVEIDFKKIKSMDIFRVYIDAIIFIDSRIYSYDNYKM